MIQLPFANGKNYAVLGLGKSGKAAVASLLASGAKVMAWDDKDSTRAAMQKEFPTLVMKPVAEWDVGGLASLVMSPGILLTHPAVIAARKVDVEVIADIELLFRAQPQATYVAITGTNGKSTTTTLIAHILEQCGKTMQVGGNLGTPALALQPLAEGEIYVLELSSYQLDLLNTFRADVAVWLNISPDHLDHHGSMEAYVDAKRSIFARQTKRDVAVVAVDDATSGEQCKALQMARQQSVIPVSAKQPLAGGIFVQQGKLFNRFGLVEAHGDIAGIKSLQGEHNWQNAAAAYAACYALGCTHDAIIAAMQNYPGLAHRMEWLGEINGVQFVNDSKATNADAAEKALRTYDNMHWIIGGVAKEGGIESLAEYFPKITHAYLIGEAADDFAKTLKGKVPFTACGTLEKAFHAAVNAAAKNSVVLLSPACASFDQYANFEVRGQAFVALVNAWKKGESTHATAS
jgi:UDP-N-acetylmuramoylalanine--D-glutamate ligase